MIYPIVIYGNEVLRKQCEEIAPDYPEVKKLVEDMFQTLGEAEGVGLAAPQIGKAIRLFIVDCTPWGEDDPECADYKRAFINPEIYAFSEEKKGKRVERYGKSKREEPRGPSLSDVKLIKV